MLFHHMIGKKEGRQYVLRHCKFCSSGGDVLRIAEYYIEALTVA